MRGLIRSLPLLLLVVGCKTATPEPGIDYPQEREVVNPPSEAGYSTVLYAVVKGGKSAGVVGVAQEGVSVTLHFGDKSIGPVMTDRSGGLTIDALSLFPDGTSAESANLEKTTPINVEIHMEKDGYRPTIEVVTFPVEQYKEFTFFLKGEGQ